MKWKDRNKLAREVWCKKNLQNALHTKECQGSGQGLQFARWWCRGGHVNGQETRFFKEACTILSAQNLLWRRCGAVWWTHWRPDGNTTGRRRRCTRTEITLVVGNLNKEGIFAREAPTSEARIFASRHLSFWRSVADAIQIDARTLAVDKIIFSGRDSAVLQVAHICTLSGDRNWRSASRLRNFKVCALGRVHFVL